MSAHLDNVHNINSRLESMHFVQMGKSTMATLTMLVIYWTELNVIFRISLSLSRDANFENRKIVEKLTFRKPRIQLNVRQFQPMSLTKL